MFGFRRKQERAVTVTAADPRFLEVFGLKTPASVGPDEALGLPAVWAAVNFLSGTVAGLPLHTYDKTTTGKKKVKATKANPVVGVLHDAVNDGLTSFQWRYNLMTAVLTEGRAVTYIERDDLGRVINLYPLPRATVDLMPNGRKRYTHKAAGKTTTYDEADVLDVAFMLRSDQVTHLSPLRQCATALGKAVQANEYGAKLFANGGLPAFALTGPFGSGEAAKRASADIAQATKEAAARGGNVLAIPLGHELKPLGSDPEKMQLVETQKFAVTEVARIYGLPPTFLQDLERATFSNSEMQDLHLVKHTVKRWLEQLEAEMNLKLFGRGSNRIVEFNLDGLLRGDYKTRMEGNARAIQTGQITPNEARALDNREPLDGGDQLLIQGATIPLAKAGEAPLQPMAPAQEETDDES
jgi:HK97 family phage portal protein